MPLKKQDRLSGLQENPQDEMLADDSDIFKNINPNLTLEIASGCQNCRSGHFVKQICYRKIFVYTF
jgi:hypothetical protein